MPKPNFPDEFSALQRQVVNRLAEIEESDRNACANCGGEDCICCEIYHDRQRWVSADELFRDDIYEMEYEPIDRSDEDEEPEISSRRSYPCDDGPPYQCPFERDGEEATGMYFCRDHCGLGVDD